jgi:hypothetical protein
MVPAVWVELEAGVSDGYGTLGELVERTSA